MTTAQKLAFNAWMAEEMNQKAALQHAIERSLHYEERIRKILNPESAEYEYVSGMLEMWDHRIERLCKNYIGAVTERSTYASLFE